MLDRYSGRYQFSKNDWVVITHAGTHLDVDGNEDPIDQYYAESPVSFFSKAFAGQMTFKLDRAGRPTEFVWSGSGAAKHYKRVQ